jgi:hypothetical protein
VTSGPTSYPSRRMISPAIGMRLGRTGRVAQNKGGKRLQPRAQRGEDGFAGGGHSELAGNANATDTFGP